MSKTAIATAEPDRPFILQDLVEALERCYQLHIDCDFGDTTTQKVLERYYREYNVKNSGGDTDGK